MDFQEEVDETLFELPPVTPVHRVRLLLVALPPPNFGRPTRILPLIRALPERTRLSHSTAIAYPVRAGPNAQSVLRSESPPASPCPHAPDPAPASPGPRDVPRNPSPTPVPASEHK